MALTDGLVSYYKFDGDATDSVGTNNGTVNGATQVSGKINSAYSFNGSNDDIALNNNIIGGYSAMTFSVWVKANSFSAVNPILKTWSDIKSNRKILIDIDTSGYIDFDIYTTTQYGGSMSSQISTNTWYFLTFTYDGSIMKLYINGTEQSTTYSASGIIQTGTLQDYFGKTNNVASEYFNGIMDEIGIWNRALTASEISELYNSGAGLSYPFGVTTSVSNNNFFTLHLGAEF